MLILNKYSLSLSILTFVPGSTPSMTCKSVRKASSCTEYHPLYDPLYIHPLLSKSVYRIKQTHDRLRVPTIAGLTVRLRDSLIKSTSHSLSVL